MNLLYPDQSSNFEQCHTKPKNMNALEFIELVRRMRQAQRNYYAFPAKQDPKHKQALLITSKQLEAEVDKAEVSLTVEVTEITGADHSGKPWPEFPLPKPDAIS